MALETERSLPNPSDVHAANLRRPLASFGDGRKPLRW